MPITAGIYFQKYGEQVKAGTFPLILVHGAGGTQLSWPAGIRRLAGYEVFALDMPGHGKSPDPSLETIPAYATVILKWLDAVGLRQVVVVGHSMGSAIALNLALEAPSRVKGLGLIGSGARLVVNPQLLDLIGNPGTYLEAVHKITRWSFSPSTPPSLTSLAERRMLETSPGVLFSDFQACGFFDETGRIGQIIQPTLVLSGQDDKMTPVPGAISLAEKIPFAELRIIPEAGHMVMLEKPKEVASRLRAFLYKLKCEENST